MWQVEKSLIVFLVSIPGLAHIFLTAFLIPKIDFWCDDSDYAGVDNDTLKVSSCQLSTVLIILARTTAVSPAAGIGTTLHSG